MGEFILISLLGSLYKLFSNVLASMIVIVIRKLISPKHMTFVKWRLLVDGMLLLNEVLDLDRVSKRECFVFKVDFKKVYDFFN